MTLLDDRLHEAVEERKAAPDSRSFVRAYARETVLRRQLEERTFSDEKRAKLAAKGHALPHGGFPIENADDLDNAIQAIGRSKNRAKTIAFIKKSAKRLGLTSKIPEAWLQEAIAARKAARNGTEFVRALAREQMLRDWELADELLQESEKTAGYAVTPHPFGKPGGPGLWKHKGLQLPPYIQNVAHGIQKSGKTESEAIAAAVGIVKRWAAGGGKVHPEVKAAAAAALAQWEALKATHGGGAAKAAAKK